MLVSLRKFLKKHLGYGRGQHRQLLLVGQAQGTEEGFGHAYALLAFERHPGYVLVQDMYYPMAVWCDRRPKNHMITDMEEIFDLFDDFHQLQLYKFNSREVDPKEKASLELELGWVMSGKRDEEGEHR